MSRCPQGMRVQVVRNALSRIMPQDTAKGSVHSLSNCLRNFCNMSMKVRRLWGPKKKEVFMCVYGFSCRMKRDLLVTVMEYTTLSRCVHVRTTLSSQDAEAGGWEMLVSIIVDRQDESAQGTGARVHEMENLLFQNIF